MALSLKTRNLQAKIKELENLNHQLNIREKELHITKSNEFERYDTISFFAEKHYADVDAHTENFTLSGSFAKKTLVKILEAEISELKETITAKEKQLHNENSNQHIS